MNKSKAWSTKKRLAMTAGFAGVIMVGALVIGSVWYRLGRLMGVFRPLNILGMVTEEVKANPQLVEIFYQTLNEQRCINRTLGFSLVVEAPMVITPTTEPNQCMEITMTGRHGQPAYIKIQAQAKTMAETITTYLQGMKNVASDTFNHPLYPATVIKGMREQIPVTLMVLNTGEKLTWSVVYYPADAEGEVVVAKLASSFKLIEKN